VRDVRLDDQRADILVTRYRSAVVSERLPYEYILSATSSREDSDAVFLSLKKQHVETLSDETDAWASTRGDDVKTEQRIGSARRFRERRRFVM